MYAVETAKMSSKGQRESRAVARDVARRLKKAEARLVKLEKAGISLPIDFENQTVVRSRRAEKHAIGRSY